MKRKKMVFWGLLIGYVVIGIVTLFYLFISHFQGNHELKKNRINLAISQTAQAFAIQFAREYYRWSVDQEQERAKRLYPYLANGLDSQAGILFSSLKVNAYPEAAIVWKVKDQGSNQSEITVLVQVIVMNDSNRKLKRLESMKVIKRWLSVPIQAVSTDRFVVRGIPYTIPPPKAVSVSLPTHNFVGQPIEGQQQLKIQHFLEHYFTVYTSGDVEQIRYLSRSTIPIHSHRGAIQFLKIQNMEVVRKGTDYFAAGQALVQERDTQIESQYPFKICLRQADTRWYVYKWNP